MLALTTVIVIACTVLPMTTEGGREALLETQVRQMESFGIQVNDQMYQQMRGRIGIAPYTTAGGVLVMSPIITAVLGGILFAVFNAGMGGTATFKQVYSVVVHAGVISALGQLFTGPLNYFRGSMASATNLVAFSCRCLPDGTFLARLAGMIDLFVVWWVFVLAIGIGVLYRRRTQPIAMALFGIVCRNRAGGRGRHEPPGGNALSRNKKILIGVGIVIVLGAIAYANVKFKRTSGVTVNTEKIQKRPLEAIVSASGKIQPKRLVNISADTMGRVTDLAVEEGDRVKKDQFLLQIDPRNLRSAVTRTEASVAAASSQMEQLREALESARVALKQAEDNYRRQQDLWKGGLTTRETLERAENDLKMRQSDLKSQEQNVKTQQLRMEQEKATLDNARVDLSKVRIESPIDGIVTRRNIEEGETVVIGTMNNAGTVLLTVADMSIIEAQVNVDETDLPIDRAGAEDEGHRRRHAGQDVLGQGDRDRQQPDSDDRRRRRRRRRRTFSSRSTLDSDDPGCAARIHVHR